MLSTKQVGSAKDVTRTVFSAWYVSGPSVYKRTPEPCCILSLPDFRGNMPLTRGRAFSKLSLRREILTSFDGHSLHSSSLHINVSRTRLSMYRFNRGRDWFRYVYITPGSSNLQSPLHLEIDSSSTRCRTRPTPLQ